MIQTLLAAMMTTNVAPCLCVARRRLFDRAGEVKFRKIRLTNAAVQQRVASMHGGVEFLELCGFQKDSR